MKVLAITQARLGSSRLNEKVLKTINGESILEIHLKRILKSKLITKLKIATTIELGNEKIIAIGAKLGLETYSGSIDNVLERFYYTALPEKPDWVVRLTSDCPLIDAKVIDMVIDFAISNNLDYASNTLDPTYPDGLDVEVFKFSALVKAYNEANLKSELEHVTPYIWKNSSFKNGKIFTSDCFKNEVDYSSVRLTVDTLEDFLVVEKLVNLIGKDNDWLDYVALINTQPDIKKLNESYSRNEGYKKSTKEDKTTMNKGQELYKKAKTIIPGGTMLLSKRPEMFLPEQWPAYFSKAKGCKVWDLDGKEYIDVSIMGIGTNTLGYGNEEVDEAVLKTIKDGNMATFNCPEEVYLAEKIIELNPWGDMVRFARSGGEINSVGIRIARAATGKDKIAICGYHGWHDWYLSVNLGSNDALAGHLLPGLEPAGVPKGLCGTTIPFKYNDFEELLDIVNNNELAAIKMEVSRNMGPENNFLQKVRQLATERNIVLIFDECTSGFRQTFGGLYKLYGVEPDMAIYGKTLGNGYAITAIVGKSWIMQAAEKSFISSTFWTERIGPTAALATLKVMEQEKSWETITNIGNSVKKRWQELASKHDLEISQWGIPALAGYTFKSEKALAYKTYITQEMLSKGYLASNSVYACIEHTPEILDGYFYELDKLFGEIRKFEDGRDIYKELKGPICHAGFKRLN